MKVAGTDLAMIVTSQVPDIVDLDGISHRFGIERYFCDTKITQIYEGTNQANRIELFYSEFGKMI